jgi:2-methylisocitrate lyase-like PEP mutase family enzyme
MSQVADIRATFRDLHREGCFILPNPWDAGSAVRLKKQGFKALASSSAAAAWGLGRDDGEISLGEALAHLTMLTAATDLPVNADFENGFADVPHAVAANVEKAVATGVAGLSVEDRPPGGRLYDFDHAVARIAAARAAIDRTDAGVVLVARTEGFLAGAPDLTQTIRRLTAFAAAGADCVYAPGIAELEANAELVRAVAPTPVNVLLSTTSASVAELAAIGVRRVSTGGAMAIRAWDAFDAAGAMLLKDGRLPDRQKPKLT